MRTGMMVMMLLYLVLSGCMKDGLEDAAVNVHPGEILLSYQETQCADPWDELEEINTSDNGSDHINQLLQFLAMFDIELISVSYEFNENVIACLECECLSGGTFFVKVHENEQLVSKLTEMGFVIN